MNWGEVGNYTIVICSNALTVVTGNGFGLGQNVKSYKNKVHMK